MLVFNKLRRRSVVEFDALIFFILPFPTLLQVVLLFAFLHTCIKGRQCISGLLTCHPSVLAKDGRHSDVAKLEGNYSKQSYSMIFSHS
jgi:hypothetical protein